MKLPSTSIAASVIGNPSALKGISYMLVATFFAAGMNTLIRHISFGMHPFEVAFFRAFFGFVVFLPVFARHGLAPLRTKRLGLHLMRGGSSVVTMLTTFTALSLSPVAKIVAVKFSGPLFAALLAMALMGEVLRLRRITALVVGFAGTLVILQPGAADLDLGAMLALISSASWALSFVMIKSLSRTDSSVTITIYMSLISFPVLGLFALPYWQTPTLVQFGWLIVLGTMGSLVHICFAQALKNADVSVVSPMDFCKLLWVSGMGFLAFGEIPTPWTWLGAVMIFASATYIAYRERLTKPKTADADPPAAPVSE